MVDLCGEVVGLLDQPENKKKPTYSWSWKKTPSSRCASPHPLPHLAYFFFSCSSSSSEEEAEKKIEEDTDTKEAGSEKDDEELSDEVNTVNLIEETQPTQESQNESEEPTLIKSNPNEDIEVVERRTD